MDGFLRHQEPGPRKKLIIKEAKETLNISVSSMSGNTEEKMVYRGTLSD